MITPKPRDYSETGRKKLAHGKELGGVKDVVHIRALFNSDHLMLCRQCFREIAL